MICYAKLYANSNEEKIYNSFKMLGATEEYIFIDASLQQKEEGTVYQLIKQLVIQERKVFIIDSLRSLGKNNREIAKELEWISENKIPIKILNIPSSMSDEQVSLSQILLENYQFLAGIEIENVKSNQRIGIEKARNEQKNLGRKKIPYPKNWKENYALWANGAISSEDFRENVALKKGTFYNLLKQYKSVAANNTALKEISV